MPLYAKALMVHVDAWRRISDDTVLREEYGIDDLKEWLELPLDKLPRDRVNDLIGCFNGIARTHVEIAVRREHCHWEMPIRLGRTFKMLLPETSEFQNMARIVALRVRLQMAEGKYADAITSLQTGYGMARQMAEQPFIVSSAVGSRIVKLMNAQLLTLCQQPDAPNLYWSIAELPSPIIDWRKAIGVEYEGIYLDFPELQVVRHASYVPEQWDRALREVCVDARRFAGVVWRRRA